MKSGITFGV